MRGQALLLFALIVTWALQATTAWNRPDETARTELIKSLAEGLTAGEEIAFLPEWEWGWAHRIRGVLPAPKFRLGLHDLHRPHRGLWLIRGPGAPAVPPELGRAKQKTSFGPYELRFYPGDQGATPLVQEISWDACKTNRRRTLCRAGKGELKRGELIFDGRFAHGYKLKLPPGGQASLVIDPKQLADRQGDEVLFRYAYDPVTGLRPFHLRLDKPGPLRFEFSTPAPDRNEMALSLGLR